MVHNISDVLREIANSVDSASANQAYCGILIGSMIALPLFRLVLGLVDPHGMDVDKRLLIIGIVLSLACAVLLLTNVLAGLSAILFLVGMIGVMLIIFALGE